MTPTTSPPPLPPPQRPAARPTADLVAPLPLTDPAKALLGDLSVRQYLDKLTAAGLTLDALRVLAVALPKPEAVWWACVCVRKAVPKPWRVAEEKALDAAEKWAIDPNDGNRRECGVVAESAGWDTAAGCAAGAAWLSGGSLSPPKLPPVSPRDDLTGQTIAGALLLASAADPIATPATLAQFLQTGMAVADGKLKKGERVG
jgi:hypothetical protein